MKDRKPRSSELEALESRIAPAQFIVTTHQDTLNANDGVLSLREAIAAANSTPNSGGPDEILFNIQTGITKIQPLSPLPTITQAVIIDGYSQPGATPNTDPFGTNANLVIELNGSLMGPSGSGLLLGGAGGSTVKGLVINGFTGFFDGGSGIRIASNNNTVAGNFLGTDVTGAVAIGNANAGVYVDTTFMEGNSNTYSGNVIGGITPEARNLISGNTYGVNVGHLARNTSIFGNLIGTDRTGLIALGNIYQGISVNDARNTFIGNGLGGRNVISGNSEEGIRVSDADQTIILGNYIGVNAAGTGPLGNGGDGIAVLDGADNTTIGDGFILSTNVIAANGGAGIVLGGLDNGPASNVTILGNVIGGDYFGTVPMPNQSHGIAIYGGEGVEIGDGNFSANLIVNNGGDGIFVDQGYSRAISIRDNSISNNAGLGIQWVGGVEDAFGVTQNDPFEIDGIVNYPVLTSFHTGAMIASVEGFFSGQANSTYVLDFYASGSGELDLSGHGEGGAYLGSMTITTDALGQADFEFAQEATLPPDAFYTATATSITSKNTSEFAQSIGPAQVFTWTGDQSSDWFNPLNWSPNGIPGAMDTAIYNGGTNDIQLISQASVANFLHSAGAVSGLGRLSVNDGLFWTGGTQGASLLLNQGATGTIGGSAPLEFIFGDLEVYGDLTINGAGLDFINGQLNIESTGYNTAGKLILQAGITDSDGPDTLSELHNRGILIKQNAGAFGALVSRIENYGSIDITAGTLAVSKFHNEDGGVVTLMGGDLSSSDPIIFDQGLLQGNGTVTGDVVNAFANIHPGGDRAIGLINIVGNLAVGPNGSFSIEVAGVTPGSGYDQIAVSGTVNLDGYLDFSLIKGFTPPTGSTFSVITASDITGGLQQTYGDVLSPVQTATALLLATPNTIEVTNTNDSGPGSLRDAINQANAASGFDIITFNIPGAGVHTISPTSELPNITDAVWISGYTQPGSIMGTAIAVGGGTNAAPTIEIEGSVASGAEHGLRILSFGANSIITGLIIHNFDTAIAVEGASDSDSNTIQGNFLGTNADGMTAANTGGGISIFSSVSTVIGGDQPEQVNVISGMSGPGISISGGAPNTHITGNLIGVGKDGVTPLGNGGAGVVIFDGRDSAIEGNVIAFNSDGVVINSPAYNNRITGNSIYGNVGLGIDLIDGAGTPGVTLNDQDDGDGGGNGLINFPVVDLIRPVVGGTLIGGFYSGSEFFDFTIDLYIASSPNASGYGEGQIYLGSVQGFSDGSGLGKFSFLAPLTLGPGQFITATTTDQFNGGTSEFSLAVSGATTTTFVWDNESGDHDWFNPLNWSPDFVPGATDTAIIDDSESFAFVSGFDAQVGSLHLLSGELTGDATLTINTNLIWSSGAMTGPGVTFIAPGATADLNGDSDLFLAGRVLHNEGAIAYTSAGQLALDGALIENAGVFDFTVNGFVSVVGGGSMFENLPGGVLRKSGGSGVTSFANGVGVHNDGIIEAQIGGLDFYDGYVQTDGRTSLAGGQISSQTTIYLAGGELVGSGTIGGSVDNSGAIVRPGGQDAVGNIFIAGNYTQSASGVLSIEIAGSSPGQFDSLASSSTVTFGGTVEALTIGGFTPTGGAFFPVVLGDGSNGTFDTELIGGFQGVYGFGGYTLALPSTVVTNMNDSGFGSLREAILLANSTPGVDTITFNIPFGEVRVIQLLTPLPDITDAVIIDGYSEFGAHANTLAQGNDANLVVNLDGSLMADGPGDEYGLHISAGNSVIKGLIINHIPGYGIIVENGGGNAIVGNWIGTSNNGFGGASNAQSGVLILDSDANLIGGTDPADRNVISGNLEEGILIIASAGTSSGNAIQGNYIGTTKDGDSAIGNGLDGILTQGANTQIGGLTPGAGNLISGSLNYSGVAINHFSAAGTRVEGNLIGTDVTGTFNLGNAGSGIDIIGVPNVSVIGNVISANGYTGIYIGEDSSTNADIRGNLIGTDITGTSGLGNQIAGIQIVDATGAQIGGTNPGDANRIAFNAGPGVSIDNIDSQAFGNRISGNSFFQNTGIAIDLVVGTDDSSGQTPNDLGDADDGPNHLQNTPVITSAHSGDTGTTIDGSFNSLPSTSFVIEFYAVSYGGGFGQADFYLGSQTVTTDAAGNTVINFSTAMPVPVGSKITALATNDLTGDTSEFALAAPLSIDFHWTGNAGDSNWFNPFNWSPSGVPGQNDAAILDINSTINLGQAFVTVGTFKQSAGVLDGNTLTILKELDWDGGTMQGFGLTDVAPGAIAKIGGSAVKVLKRDLGLESGGVWTGTGDIDIQAGGSLFNFGLFDVQTDADFINSDSFGPGRFENMEGATFRKSAGTDITSTSSANTVAFNDHGVIEVLTGTLALYGNSGHDDAVLVIAPGATLLMSGANHNFFGDSTVSGGGTLIHDADDALLGDVMNITGAGTTVVFDNDIRIYTVNVGVGTTLVLDGEEVTFFFSLNVSGTVKWNSGNVNGQGPGFAAVGGQDGLAPGGLSSINIQAGAVLDIDGTAPRDIDRLMIDNMGTINVTSTANITFYEVQIQNSGLFDIKSDITLIDGGFGAEISNQSGGVIRKSAGAGAAYVEINIGNDGLLDVQSGNLGLYGYVQNSGTLNVASGTSVIVDGTLTVDGGAITGSGTIDASVDNNGAVIQPGGSALGVLTVTGDYTASSSASLAVQIAGLTPGSGHDQLVVNGTADLDGTLDIDFLGAFLPPNNTPINVVTYSSGTGQFSTLTGDIDRVSQVATPTSIQIVHAGTAYVWDAGAGGDTNWFNPSNWSPDGVPGVGDTAALNINATITLGSDVTVDMFFQDSGTLFGAGNLTALLGLAWQGGVQSGPGSTILPLGAVSTIFGAAGKTLDGGRTLINAGSLAWFDAGNITLLQGSIINQASGMFGIGTDADLVDPDGNGNSGSFTNEGTLVKSGATGVTSFYNTSGTFKNTGIVHASDGVLSFDFTTISDGGSWIADSGANVEFSIAPTINTGTSFFGSGVNLLKNGANVSGSISSANLELAGGTWNGSATVTGDLTWSAGTLGAGTLTIPALSILEIVGASDVTIANHTIVNAGTIAWSGAGNIVTLNGGINNQSGALFDIQTDADIVDPDGNSNGFSIVNAGTWQKSAGSSVTSIFNTSGTFTNSGSVSVTAGSLQFDYGVISSGLFNAGTLIRFNAAPTLNAGTFMTGSGVNLLAAGANLAGTIQSENLEFSAGTWNGTGAVNGKLKWSGGTLGTGTLTIPSGSILDIVSAADVTIANYSIVNGGNINWTGAGNIITLNGGINNQSGALFDIQTDADIVDPDGNGNGFSIVNAGTWQKSAGSSVTSIFNANGAFTNSGSVGVTAGSLQFDYGVISSGLFNAGTLIRFNAAPTLNAGTFMTGSGVNLLAAGANLAGTIQSENLEFSAGTWNGTGAVNGKLKWSGGTLGTGTLTIPSGSILDIVSAADVTIANYSIVNGGNINWTGAGNIITLNGGINNQAGGTFEIQTDADIVDPDGNGNGFSIINAGTWRKSGGSGVTSIFNASGNFTNSGLVDVTAGTLRFDYGVISSGSFNAGALIQFDAAPTLNTGTVFSGSGVNRLTAGANLAGNISTENLEVASGTWSGTGTVSGNWSVTGPVTFAGNGVTTQGSGTLTLASPSDMTLQQHTLRNQGTIVWTGAGNLIGLNGQIDNLATGLFDMRSDADMVDPDGNGNGVSITNAGTWLKSGGVGLSSIFNASGSFTNTGTVSVSAGALQVSFAFNNSGTANAGSKALILSGGGSSSGTFVTSEGGLVEFAGGTHVLTTGADLGGDGLYQISSGSLNADGAVNASHLALSGGAIGGTNILTVTNSFDWSGGSKVGSGSLTLGLGSVSTLSGAADKTINGGSFKNAGSLTWTGAGNIVILNGTLDNLATGLLNIQTDADITDPDGNGNAGSVNNAGIWRKSVATGVSSIANASGAFTNTGTVDAQSGTIQFDFPVVSNAGTWLANSGATVLFNSKPDLNGGSVFNGTGVVRLANGATVNGNLSSTNLELAGGTWDGTATLNGSLDWSGGTLGSGTLTVAAGSVVHIVGASDVTIANHTINNQGSIVWPGAGNIVILNGAINNQGLFDIQTDADIIDPDGNGNAFTISNSGIWQKSVATGITTISNSVGAFTNTGGVFGTSGRITFNYPYIQTSGTTALFGGEIGTSSSLQIQGGTLDGSGTIAGSVNATGGTITPGGPGLAASFTITGDLTIGSGATLQVDLAGTSPGTFDTLTVQGNATAGGTLLVNQPGFTAAFGDQFRIINSSNNPGVFANFTGSIAGLTQVPDGTGLALLQNGVVFTWDNEAGDGDWFNPLNWDLNNGVPGINDTAILSINSTINIGAGLASVATFKQSNGVLTGELNIGASLDWSGGSQSASGATHLAAGSISNISGTVTLSGHGLTNSGALTLDGASLSLLGASISNDGTFVLANGADLVGVGAAGGSSFLNLNSGIVHKLAGAGTSVVGSGTSFLNAGTVLVDAGLLQIDGSYSQSSGATVLVGGDISNVTALNLQGGFLDGVGSVTGDVNNSGAIVRPGGSGAAGTISITGTYFQGSSGVLEVEAGGLGIGQSDLLAVGGAASLDGTLNVPILPGFGPGDYTLITFASNTAPFAITNVPPFSSVSTQPTSIHLNVVAPPNPLVVNTDLDTIDPADAFTSLREAILFANSNPGLDTITFAIPGGGVHVIHVLDQTLPAITDAVVIDGYSQPGASLNTLNVGSDAVLLIQIDASGVSPSDGLFLVSGSSGSTIKGLIIGGGVIGLGLVGGHGIEISGSDNITIEGNFIGSVQGNQGAGIAIQGGSGHLIGGTSPASRNVIGGNSWGGINVYSASSVEIVNNYIGTDSSGAGTNANSSGIVILDSSSVVVSNNLISGNSLEAISIVGPNSTGNVVIGNLIGVDASGSNALGNAGGSEGQIDGAVIVAQGAHGNTIGGVNPGDRNVISGNYLSGIAIQDLGTDGNMVVGNYIGLSADGTAAIGNEGPGIVIFDGPAGTVIGGASVQARNAIAGNDGDGISVSLAGSGTVIAGNYIGTNATGSAAFANIGDGISLLDSGAVSITGNVISGNTGAGVSLRGAATTGVVIAGNNIGLSANPAGPTPNGGSSISGTSALGNGAGGILIASSAHDNTIGGTSSSELNVISGNTGNGVLIADPASSGNVVIGNYIGTDGTATVGIPNTLAGIAITGGASNNKIGDIAAGAGNVIAFNSVGVSIGSTSTGTAILGNNIQQNTGLNIDLNGDGATPNDGAPDADTGGNNLQNFPVLDAALQLSGTTFNGSLNSKPNSTYRIELHLQSSGGGASSLGATLLDSFVVTTDAAGLASLTRSISQILPVGTQVVATATEVGGDGTSEFSGAISVAPPPTRASVHDAIVVEGDNGTKTIVFHITLDQAVNATVTVNFATSDLTAIAGLDYVATSGVVTFAPNEVDQIFSITVNGDTLSESRERFAVSITGANGAAIDQGQAFGIIQDDDHHTIAIGQAKGNLVRVYNVGSSGATLVSELQAFAGNYQGGVRVAVGDVTGDGVDDYILGGGLGGRGKVRVFDGTTDAPVTGVLGSLDAFGGVYRGGVFVAAGDVNGDGHADVIVSPSAGSLNQVRVFSGLDGSLLSVFQAFGRGTGGVRVAAGDINGDGLDDVVVGTGKGSSVRVFDGLTGQILQDASGSNLDFRAFGKKFKAGIYVAAGDTNNDGIDDIIASGATNSAKVKVFEVAPSGPEDRTFDAYAGALRGVRVAVTDINSDGIADIITTKGKKSDGTMSVFAGDSLSQVLNFVPFGRADLGYYLG